MQQPSRLARKETDRQRRFAPTSVHLRRNLGSRSAEFRQHNNLASSVPVEGVYVSMRSPWTKASVSLTWRWVTVARRRKGRRLAVSDRAAFLGSETLVITSSRISFAFTGRSLHGTGARVHGPLKGGGPVRAPYRGCAWAVVQLVQTTRATRALCEDWPDILIVKAAVSFAFEAFSRFAKPCVNGVR